MPFTSSGDVLVEVVIFNGRRYRRYPNAKRSCHRNYFSRSGHLLHRDVWEHHNGPIPDGHHVHHIDRNTLNNDISNLECIPVDDHWNEHKVERSQNSSRPSQIQHLESIRNKAKDWHKSEAGKEWHRQHAKQSIAKPGFKKPPLTLKGVRKCEWCGEEFEYKNIRNTLCSTLCQSAKSRYTRGISPTVTEYFSANRDKK